jgi:hypothetical protein
LIQGIKSINTENMEKQKEIDVINFIYSAYPIKCRYDILFDEDVHEKINWENVELKDSRHYHLMDRRTHWAVWEYVAENNKISIYRTENIGALVQLARYIGNVVKVETIIF